MSKFIKNTLLFLLATITLFALSGCVLTFKGCEDTPQPTPPVETFYFSYTSEVLNTTENDLTIYLSVNGSAFQPIVQNTTVEETSVYKFLIYYDTENADYLRLSTVSYGDIINDIKDCTSASTALNVVLSEDTEIFIDFAMFLGVDVETSATLRRQASDAGVLLFMSVNGGNFEEVASLTATDLINTKTVENDFEEVYAISFYYELVEDSRAVSAVYKLNDDETTFSQATSEQNAIVLSLSEESELVFALTVAPTGFNVPVSIIAQGNVANGISISADGGQFVNYSLDPQGSIETSEFVIPFAKYIDFYFIFDSAVVDQKTAKYSTSQVSDVSFVNSTHDNPVHLDVNVENFGLFIETSASISNTLTLKVKFSGAPGRTPAKFFYKINDQSTFTEINDIPTTDPLIEEEIQNVNTFTFYVVHYSPAKTTTSSWYGQPGNSYIFNAGQPVIFAQEGYVGQSNTINIDVLGNSNITIFISSSFNA